MPTAAARIIDRKGFPKPGDYVGLGLGDILYCVSEEGAVAYVMDGAVPRELTFVEGRGWVVPSVVGARLPDVTRHYTEHPFNRRGTWFSILAVAVSPAQAYVVNDDRWVYRSGA